MPRPGDASMGGRGVSVEKVDGHFRQEHYTSSDTNATLPLEEGGRMQHISTRGKMEGRLNPPPLYQPYPITIRSSTKQPNLSLLSAICNHCAVAHFPQFIPLYYT
ncbi:hypothetical protein E2C01_006525 [Portunus trituberculatus]|uniref:Uncharacterized protein n=1 Tax=Portunus trituberculatus TaxID=210409 RepID=A0A5B7CY41_PORTR|nr:hypothetical protein [Portunus trituberculatus]